MNQTGSQENKSTENQINLPELAIPHGGGTVHGIGEHFHADAFTGSAAFNLPIPFPKARKLTPDISISYNSVLSNGLMGCGFSLATSSISRKTSRAIPKYADEDHFVIDGGNELVLKEGASNIYLERHQNTFPYVEQLGSDEQIYWKVIDKENITSIYGQSEISRVRPTNNKQKIFKWHLEKQMDAFGNIINYGFKRFDSQDTNTYLTSIEYGNYKSDKFLFKVLLDY